MNINVICIGKIKERYWTDAIAEYSKRLSRYCTLNIKELKEDRLPDNASEADEHNVKINEGRSILKAVGDNSYVIALDLRGKQLSSEGLSDKINNLGLEGQSNIDFIIGGSLGLSEDVLKCADYRLSFSAMTFPHQMMRVILLEQIYRSFKIIKNETYHK
jgi:23S rRNA (pseudouridine1915-N3)-methyltransferase